MTTGQIKPFPAFISPIPSRIFIPQNKKFQKFLEIYYNAAVFKSKADVTVILMVAIPPTDTSVFSLKFQAVSEATA